MVLFPEQGEVVVVSWELALPRVELLLVRGEDLTEVRLDRLLMGAILPMEVEEEEILAILLAVILVTEAEEVPPETLPTPEPEAILFLEELGVGALILLPLLLN